MNEKDAKANHTDWVNHLSPREVVEQVITRGDPERHGLGPYVEALAYARVRNWRKLELEQYVKLGVLLDRQTELLESRLVKTLCTEIAWTEITEDIDVVLGVLLATLEHVGANDPGRSGLLEAFERRMEKPATAWKARLMVGDFLTRLEKLDAALAEERRGALTRRVAEWALDYHTANAPNSFDVRSRGMFEALLAATWSDRPSENVDNGLDGAFNCALDKLMQTGRFDWLGAFLGQLTDKVSQRHMYRRLSGETLYEIGETLTRARRRVYGMSPQTALAITAFEDAIHRPHRLQLESAAVKLELELPGPRGFGEGVRLRVFDISRDGCLAVMDGPARFEETPPTEEFRLERGPGRSYPVRRLAGVVRRKDSPVTVRAGTEVVLHETSKGDREWAAIDRASVVRFTPDEQNNRLWLGFHFDRVVPEVQRNLEDLVYAAA